MSQTPSVDDEIKKLLEENPDSNDSSEVKSKKTIKDKTNDDRNTYDYSDDIEVDDIEW